MKNAALICLAASFLVTAGVHAQSPQETNSSDGAAGGDLRLVSARLLHTGVLSHHLTLAEPPVLISWNSQTEQPTAPKTSHAGRVGALIGLAAGIAGAGLYWANTNCRYGSDSAGAIVGKCVAPSAAMVVGGWWIGRTIGRRKEHKKPEETDTGAFSISRTCDRGDVDRASTRHR